MVEILNSEKALLGNTNINSEHSMVIKYISQKGDLIFIA